LAAQESRQDAAAPQRRPILGRVLDEQGNPCSGASVTMYGVQPFWIERAGDTVTVAADERGRFVAKVLPSVPYCGFAITAPSTDGAVGASRIVGWFGAGAQVRLVCGAAIAKTTMRAVGSAAWSDQGPLAWSLLAADTERSCGSAVPLVIGTDGNAVLPAFFAARAVSTGPRTALCEVRTAQGQLLWSRLCAPGPQLEVVLPPPRAIPLVVRDDNQQPIQGASVAVRQGYRGDGGVDGLDTVRGQLWRELGHTDADGRLTASVPLDLDPFAGVVGEAWVFRARSEGRAESMSGFLGNQDLRDDQRIARDDQREVRFTLKAQPTRVLRIVRSGAAVAGVSVRIDLIAKLGVNGAGFTHDPRSFVAASDAEGVVAVPFAPSDIHGMRVQILEPGTTEPIVCAPDVVQFGQTIDLAACACVRLRVRDAHDGPCAGASGYVRWAKDTSSGLAADLRFVTDAVGSAVLRLFPVGEWEFALGSVEAGVCCERVDVAELAPDVLELRLQAFLSGRGRLLDAEERPVAGACIRKWEFAGDVLPESRLHAAFVRQMQARLCLPVVTGADGAFALPVVPLHRPSLRLSFAFGVRTSEVAELAPDLGPVTLHLR
jgi:hypothetical protein